MVIARVGLDIAKNVFQVNGVASDDSIVVRRQLRRHQVLAFFGCCRAVLSGSRLVLAPITGDASSLRWVTKYD